MSRPLAQLCLVLLCLLLLARVAPALAQTDIHHCIGANGGAVFTDQPCSALNATPVSPAAAAASTSPLTAPLMTAPLPVLCAASADELRQSVIDAFAGRDTIRLGGLILWDGYGRGAALTDMRSLMTLMKQPLLEVEIPQHRATSTPPDDDPFADPFADPTSAPPTPPPMDQLVLHTASHGSGDAASTWRFDIVRQAGCLWLRNAN